jgi:hypothetical protein
MLIETPPAPADYASGTFARIPLDRAAGDLIGLIYDTDYEPAASGDAGSSTFDLSSLHEGQSS